MPQKSAWEPGQRLCNPLEAHLLASFIISSSKNKLSSGSYKKGVWFVSFTVTIDSDYEHLINNNHTLQDHRLTCTV